MRNIYFYLLILSFLTACGGTEITADVQPQTQQQRGTENGISAQMIHTPDTLRYGLQLPAHGHHHILVVFVTPDTEADDWGGWPINHDAGLVPDDENPFDTSRMPEFMQNLIDPVPHYENRPDVYENITQYFETVSRGKYIVTGDVAYVSGPPEGELGERANFGDYNRWVLKNRIDGHVDWADYDHWTTFGREVHKNEPDKEVDMVLMIWRYKTDLFNVSWHGTGRLGSMPPTWKIGDGYTIRYSGVNNSVSGLSMAHRGNWNRMFSYIPHEFAHRLIGTGHTYSGRANEAGYGLWGLFYSAYDNLSVNAYEADYLGWADIIEVNSDTTVVLPDFLSTGKTIRLDAGNGELFYITNRQKKQKYDEAGLIDDDTGIFVKNLVKPYLSMRNSTRPLASDGNYEWDIVDFSTACDPSRPERPMPVFAKKRPHPGKYSFRDPIPAAPDTTRNMYHLPEDPDTCSSYHRGRAHYTSFSADADDRPDVLSPFTNPNTHRRNGEPTGLRIQANQKDADGNIPVDISYYPLITHYVDGSEKKVLEADQYIFNRYDEVFFMHGYFLLGSEYHIEETAVYIDPQKVLTPGGELTLHLDAASVLYVDDQVFSAGTHVIQTAVAE